MAISSSFSFLLLFTTIISTTVVLIYRYVGEVHTVELSTTTSHPPAVACPGYLDEKKRISCWILGDNTCYCFSEYNTTYSWEQANSECKERKMNLVSFEGEKKNEDMDSLLMIARNIPGFTFWTAGLYNSSAERWEWFPSGTPIRFDEQYSLTYRVADLKESEENEGKCLLLSVLENNSPSHISPRNCESYGYRFICQKEI